MGDLSGEFDTVVAFAKILVALAYEAYLQVAKGGRNSRSGRRRRKGRSYQESAINPNEPLRTIVQLANTESI